MKLEIISRYPSVGAHSTPLLSVHGALHGAWCWEVHFLDYFARHGFAAHAVNLRGDGNSEPRNGLRWTRIADYVEDLTNAARQLPTPPILIGHSMGGFIIEKYLEDHSPPAAVLLTTPPPSGLFGATLRIAKRRDNMLRPSEIQATARAYNTQAEFVADVAHNVMLELRWQAVAERILVWLRDLQAHQSTTLTAAASRATAHG